MTEIVLDLEWNGSYSKKAHGYFNEIIEIGAVRVEDGCRMADTFHAVIRPVYSEKLTEFVTNLTNITEGDLAQGETFPEAVDRIRRWMGDGDTVLLTWSTTDLLVLIENCERFFGCRTIPFMKAYADLQAYTQKRMGEDLSRQLALGKACEKLSISEEGADLHRALDDSILSARIFIQLYEASFAGEIQPVNQEFYDRITFKSYYIRDIDSPLIPRSELQFRCPACNRNLKREGDWKYRNRAFYADFRCGECERRFVGRVQCKRKYEGVVFKKKLIEQVKVEGQIQSDNIMEARSEEQQI